MTTSKGEGGKMKQYIEGNLLRLRMMKFDWMKILYDAIKSRPSSWKYGTDSVIEWRNASDEVCMAVLHEMENEGLIPDMFGRHGGLKTSKKEKIA